MSECFAVALKYSKKFFSFSNQFLHRYSPFSAGAVSTRLTARSLHKKGVVSVKNAVEILKDSLQEIKKVFVIAVETAEESREKLNGIIQETETIEEFDI